MEAGNQYIFIYILNSCYSSAIWAPVPRQDIRILSAHVACRGKSKHRGSPAMISAPGTPPHSTPRVTAPALGSTTPRCRLRRTCESARCVLPPLAARSLAPRGTPAAARTALPTRGMLSAPQGNPFSVRASLLTWEGYPRQKLCF